MEKDGVMKDEYVCSVNSYCSKGEGWRLIHCRQYLKWRFTMHRRLGYCPDLAGWWWVMSSYLSKWDSNQRLEFEPQSHLNNPWPTSTVPFLRDFPNLRAMPQGLELLADSVLTPNYNVVRANPLYNLTPSTWNSLPDAWDYSARHGHQLPSPRLYL